MGSNVLPTIKTKILSIYRYLLRKKGHLIKKIISAFFLQRKRTNSMAKRKSLFPPATNSQIGRGSTFMPDHAPRILDLNFFQVPPTEKSTSIRAGKRYYFL